MGVYSLMSVCIACGRKSRVSLILPLSCVLAISLVYSASLRPACHPIYIKCVNLSVIFIFYY